MFKEVSVIQFVDGPCALPPPPQQPKQQQQQKNKSDLFTTVLICVCARAFLFLFNYIPFVIHTRWLEKNSLSALHLGLMDAFGPASIPHTSKYVPLLGKSVSSTVFSSLFPLAHITNNHKVTLIHPNGVNLSDYERLLDRQIEVYQARLARLAWASIPEDMRGDLAVECGVGVGEEPGACVYLQHRGKLRAAVAKCDWLRPQEDFDLLEHQIEVGNNFKKYLKALRKEATKKMDTSWKGSGSSSSDSDERKASAVVTASNIRIHLSVVYCMWSVYNAL